MDHAHEPDPYYPNSDHRRMSFVLRICDFHRFHGLLGFHHFFRILGSILGSFWAWDHGRSGNPIGNSLPLTEQPTCSRRHTE
jgi:hypothetical protein